ncbi:hypothetical protein KFL_003640080 [Klebsormidium nitens]|uniref:Glycosyl transferase CAP10 domain-containing protein n=1 Tax=Klebsormidium nitens TaxID=105231 RepID=A0A1Y1IFR5_KLENI|nr:hypothetical protein KFL_003640080 [Klebsormidium nitens]|eukprot:GAQ87606.1 hypothetical protein KFL_003640080 [Klebsormidium nitens]
MRDIEDGGDVEFLLCQEDCIVTQRQHHPARVSDAADVSLPILNVVSCDGSADIPFPYFEHVDGPPRRWAAAFEDARAARAAHSPALRIRKAVFRGGGGRGCFLDADDRGWGGDKVAVSEDTWQRCGRERLVFLVRAGSRPELYDVMLSDTDQVGGFREWAAGMVTRGRPRLSRAEQEAYRAVIHVEGNCGWANRLKHELHMGTVLLKQRTPCWEYYELGLRPWEHFVPVDYNLSNLTAAIEWVLANGEEADAMVNRMHAYADEVLGPDLNGMKAYTTGVLRGLQGLVRYKVEKRPGMAKFRAQDRLLALLAYDNGSEKQDKGRFGGTETVEKDSDDEVRASGNEFKVEERDRSRGRSSSGERTGAVKRLESLGLTTHDSGNARVAAYKILLRPSSEGAQPQNLADTEAASNEAQRVVNGEPSSSADSAEQVTSGASSLSDPGLLDGFEAGLVLGAKEALSTDLMDLNRLNQCNMLVDMDNYDLLLVGGWSNFVRARTECDLAQRVYPCAVEDVSKSLVEGTLTNDCFDGYVVSVRGARKFVDHFEKEEATGDTWQTVDAWQAVAQRVPVVAIQAAWC